ncbi:hypothetical protein ACHQM5_004946 [Ranunculus cassubicifolius]
MDLQLPADIFLDIFSRLPIKSLLRCRCVSKTWRHLSLHPHLPNMHLSLASQSSSNPTTFILYTSQLDSNAVNTKLYYLEFDQTSCLHQPIKLQFPLESWFNRFTVVGSCNGLLCLLEFSSHHQDIYIFNPSIGDYIQLPQCGYGSPTSFGFGFDSTAASSDGEYKVVRIYSDVTDLFSLSAFVSSIKVYTLGDSLWRNVTCGRDFKYYIDHKLPSVFVRGGLHWKCFEKVDRHECLGSVACFNLRSEGLSIIPFPDFINELDLMHKVSLVELKGCLSFYRTTFHMLSWYRITIWIMKDYGVKDSWVKQFVIKDSVVFKPDIKYARPLCVNSDGEILLICGGKQLVAYDPQRKIYRELGYYETLDSVTAVIHVGSLVPLKVDNERGSHL